MKQRTLFEIGCEHCGSELLLVESGLVCSECGARIIPKAVYAAHTPRPVAWRRVRRIIQKRLTFRPLFRSRSKRDAELADAGLVQTPLSFF